DPLFQLAYAFVPASIGIVELDRLVVFQKYVNLTYARTLAASLGTQPTAEAIFRFCLPFDHPQPSVTGGRIAQNAYSFYSASSDFRFLDAPQLTAAQVVGHVPQGPVSAVVALMIGYGSNFLNAIQ